MDEDNEQSMGDLVTYEIDYGDTAMEGGAEYTLERYQAIAGGNVASIIEGYAETNGYEIREIEGKGADLLEALMVCLKELEDWNFGHESSEGQLLAAAAIAKIEGKRAS